MGSKSLSEDLAAQNYFHNRAKMLFAVFTLILSQVFGCALTTLL